MTHPEDFHIINLFEENKPKQETPKSTYTPYQPSTAITGDPVTMEKVPPNPPESVNTFIMRRPTTNTHMRLTTLVDTKQPLTLSELGAKTTRKGTKK